MSTVHSLDRENGALLPIRDGVESMLQGLIRVVLEDVAANREGENQSHSIDDRARRRDHSDLVAVSENLVGNRFAIDLEDNRDWIRELPSRHEDAGGKVHEPILRARESKQSTYGVCDFSDLSFPRVTYHGGGASSFLEPCFGFLGDGDSRMETRTHE